MRAVVYARYSSDLQHDASIADQVRVCTEYAQQTLNAAVVATYADPAKSGASAFRPEFQKMIADSARGRFEAVLCVSIDRLGRRLADVAHLHDVLSHRRISLYSPSLGLITPMHIAVYGLMGQEQLRVISSRTKSGQAGRIEKGKLAGGLAYGYRALPPVQDGKAWYAGEREIIPEQAAIVRRLMEEFARGESPIESARRLNLEKIPGPRGGEWRDTAIRGHDDRGTGILNNELYLGRLIWNKTSYVKDPETGKRQPRPNPPEQWMVTEVPHLRIVDDDLWTRVKARQRKISQHYAKAIEGHRTNALNGTHREKFLLSGLLVCPVCGGGYTIVGKDRYGCANRNRGKGTCANAKTIKRQTVERRVLAGLKDRLLAPELVRQFVREVREEVRRKRKNGDQRRSELEKLIAKKDSEIDGLFRAIELGNASVSINQRLTERENEKAALVEELAALQEPATNVEALPNLAEVFAVKVANLTAALDDPDLRSEAHQALRTVIQKVVITPDADAPDGIRVELHGVLAEILALCHGQKPRSKLPASVEAGSQLTVVAGTCITRNHTSSRLRAFL